MNIQTITTTLSTANQTAVPSKIRNLWELQAGDKLLWEIEPKKKIVKIKPTPSRWGSYMRGLGKQMWSNIDANKYVQNLRRDRNI